MAPTAQSTLFCTQADVEDYLSAEGVDLRLDDDNDSLVSAGELARLTARGLNVATARVKLYLQPVYDDADLATSWVVNEWATVVAARWLCGRRGNPVPGSVAKAYEEIIQEMQAVKARKLQLPDVGTRNPDWPAWSNVNVNWNYRFSKVRVEKNISEPTSTQYSQKQDYASAHTFEI